MVLADWIVNGLYKGDQCQVYSKCRRDDALLFSKTFIAGADVIQRHIEVVERHWRGGGLKNFRTYFVDDNALFDSLLDPQSEKRLCGFNKRTQTLS